MLDCWQRLAPLVLVAGPSSVNVQAQEVQPDWVQVYDDAQFAHSFDFLLACWVQQWPYGVGFYEGPDAATSAEIESAIQSTRENCELQMYVRFDQIKVDLARQGIAPDAMEAEAELLLEVDLKELFDEYWSRL